MRFLVPLLLHGYFIFFVFSAFFAAPEIKPASPENRRFFFETHPGRVLKMGADFKPVAALLPPRGAISFLFEKPYQKLDTRTREILLTAQAYACPLVLDPEPGQAVGFMVGFDPAAADQRVQDAGYGWAMRSSAGKGLIKKLP